jgi:Uma2 family endonuclease
MDGKADPMSSIEAVEVRRHRLTRADYYRMAEVGILPPKARVELIEGEIIDMPAIGSQHAGNVNFLNEQLILNLRGRATVTCQSPLVLSEWTEPVPDLCVLRRRGDFYRESHPEPGDAVLVIEVAYSTLAYDAGTKAALYARAGIPEYWVVDLGGGALIVHREPAADGYREIVRHAAPERLPVPALADTEIDLSPLWQGAKG